MSSTSNNQKKRRVDGENPIFLLAEKFTIDPMKIMSEYVQNTAKRNELRAKALKECIEDAKTSEESIKNYLEHIMQFKCVTCGLASPTKLKRCSACKIC